MLSDNERVLVAILVFFGVLVIVCCAFLFYDYISDGEFDGQEFKGYDKDNDRFLNWEVRETIEYSYEECKDINRSEPIKRLFKRDYRLTMCPQAYVVLYDESQKIVFMYNRENEKVENPTILTISVSCDNSTGEC